MASCERAASHVRQKGCCDVHGCLLPFPKSTNLVWRALVPAVVYHDQKEMSRNFRRKKKSLQWSSATLRLLSEARSPKRRSFVGCNLISKRSAIKTQFEAACTVSARSSSEKSNSSGWWTCTTVEISMSFLPGKTISPYVCPFWYITVV